MEQIELNDLKKEVLAMGDETKAYCHIVLKTDGKLVWRFGGTIGEATFLSHHLIRMIDKEFDKRN